MAIAIPSEVQNHVVLADIDARGPPPSVFTGYTALDGALTLLGGPSVLAGGGGDPGLTRLALDVCRQATVVGWRTVWAVDWDAVGLPPGTDSVTTLWQHLLKQFCMLDLILDVTWNRRENLLCKDYFRFLSKEVCYPYNHPTKDQWFTATVTRQEELNGKVTNKEYTIKALNSTDKEWKKLSGEEEEYLGKEGKPGYWYHGTHHTSAVSILEEEIQLRKGMAKQDFSDENGFYMSQKFECAKLWASKIASTRGRAAVLVFNLCDLLIDERFQRLDLTGDGDVSAAGWAAVVKYNRCGKRDYAPLSGFLRKRFDKSDYIIGPMSGGPLVKCPGGVRSCKDWRPQKNTITSDQLCIKTEKAAEAFGSLADQHIEAVIFYGD